MFLTKRISGCTAPRRGGVAVARAKSVVGADLCRASGNIAATIVGWMGPRKLGAPFKTAPSAPSCSRCVRLEYLGR